MKSPAAALNLWITGKEGGDGGYGGGDGGKVEEGEEDDEKKQVGEKRCERSTKNIHHCINRNTLYNTYESGLLDEPVGEIQRFPLGH